MKKGFRFSVFSVFCLVFFILSGLNLSAQVNRDELQNLGQVEFVNYEGPYSRIETRAQIRGIGYSLGALIRTGQARAGAGSRYFIISSISDPDGSKIDADIMGLGGDVGVVHVRNLRFIIQGYLEAAYNYTERDAALLAEYITIYNAVYRGDMNYFDSRYKNDVMSNITRDKAGLSIRYDEWPGRTLMLIPLGLGGAGSLNSIDTSVLTDPLVTEQLREEPDSGIGTRRDMVDLMERQSDEANRQAAAQREEIRQEESRLEQKKDDMSDQELAERQQKLDEQKDQADQIQQYADLKAEDAQRERQNIADDQQAMINKGGQDSVEVKGVVGVSILTSNASLGRVVIVDPETGKERRRSGLTTLNARTLTDLNGRLIAIAGENRGNAAIRLVEINSATLEMVKQGDDDIAPTSLLWASGSDLYAISSSGGNLYIARFNTNLERQARSSVTVHPFAAVSFFDGNLLTQRSDGTALVLNPGDLTERR
ncbi:MAG: hypothetical protein LBH43_20770 [Treponema sp.]|jgi:hypothetical protein|nr:hypothetical protein [Treponema sp.]